MTDEVIDTTVEARSAVAVAVMEALKSGRGIASLQPLLQEASLSPEQRAVMEFLQYLDEVDDGLTASGDLDELTNEADSDAAELEGLRDEVADLREVNDAAAAALGACPVCWGGDKDCPVCAGAGEPGANLPDLRLYNELVRPAVARMNAAHPTIRPVPQRDEAQP